MVQAPESLAVLLFAVTAIAWVLYFRWKDARRAEPWPLTLVTLAGGAGSALLSLSGYEVLERLGLGVTWEQLAGADLLLSMRAALRIGVVEELSKLTPVIVVALLRREVDEELDGIVYAAFAALGFAAAESATLLWRGALDPTSIWARALAAPLSHALFTAPAGLGVAVTVLRRRFAPVLVGTGAAIGLHALYNWMLARPEIPDATGAIVVALVWGWLLWIAPRLARLPRVAR